MKRLRLERHFQNLSQKELANKAYVSHTEILYLEQGKWEPSPETIQSIANALEWDRNPQDLLKEVERGDVV